MCIKEAFFFSICLIDVLLLWMLSFLRVKQQQQIQYITVRIKCYALQWQLHTSAPVLVLSAQAFFLSFCHVSPLMTIFCAVVFLQSRTLADVKKNKQQFCFKFFSRWLTVRLRLRLFACLALLTIFLFFCVRVCVLEDTTLKVFIC